MGKEKKRNEKVRTIVRFHDILYTKTTLAHILSGLMGEKKNEAMNYVNRKQLQDLDSLRARLLQTNRWPIRYMFKFIAPNNEMVIHDLLATMPQTGQTRVLPSKDNRYVSVTHIDNMYSADDIIKFTIKATSIDGVIAL